MMLVRTVITLIAGVGAGAAACCSVSSASDDKILRARGYFGDILPGLESEEQAAVERGFIAFSKIWSGSPEVGRNATSCVACHNIPMPGGSGNSKQSLVLADQLSPRTGGESTTGPIPKSLPTSLSRRRTPALFGMGYLEHIIIPVNQVGRFGALAKVDSLEKFVADAFDVELGLKSHLHCSKNAVSLHDRPCILTPQDIKDVSNFIRYLSPPPASLNFNFEGAELFERISCSACHVAKAHTSQAAPLPFRDVLVPAFTDMTLHDIGRSAPIRTPPLWGLNSTGPPYMHDGSAASIEGAIELHSGEAKLSRDRFFDMTSDEQMKLLRFLKNL